jgi:hypothetical protein
LTIDVGNCQVKFSVLIFTVVPENPEIKATAVFRSQLMNPPSVGNSGHLALPDDLARLKPEQVQVVAKEPRVSS